VRRRAAFSRSRSGSETTVARADVSNFRARVRQHFVAGRIPRCEWNDLTHHRLVENGVEGAIFLLCFPE